MTPLSPTVCSPARTDFRAKPCYSIMSQHQPRRANRPSRLFWHDAASACVVASTPPGLSQIRRRSSDTVRDVSQTPLQGVSRANIGGWTRRVNRLIFIQISCVCAALAKASCGLANGPGAVPATAQSTRLASITGKGPLWAIISGNWTTAGEPCLQLNHITQRALHRASAATNCSTRWKRWFCAKALPVLAYPK